jgi:hypothetical protein
MKFNKNGAFTSINRIAKQRLKHLDGSNRKESFRHAKSVLKRTKKQQKNPNSDCA